MNPREYDVSLPGVKVKINTNTTVEGAAKTLQRNAENKAKKEAIEAGGGTFDPTTQVFKGNTQQFNDYANAVEQYKQQVAEINQRNITPKLSIENGNVKLSGTQTALALKTTENMLNEFNNNFKNYSMDINSPEVANYVQELNAQAQQQAREEVQDIATKQMYGWDDQQLADYKYTQETVRQSNPSKSKNLIKGYKDGEIVSMTYSDWVEYINGKSRDEEETLLTQARTSTDPYLHAIWQIATRGGDSLAYDMSSPTGPTLGEGKPTYEIRNLGERFLTGLEQGGLEAGANLSGLLSGIQNVGSVGAAILPALTGDESRLAEINQEMKDRDEYVRNFREEVNREMGENSALSPVASTLGSLGYNIAKFVGESIVLGAGLGAVGGAVRGGVTGTGMLRGAAQGARNFRLMNISDKISKPIIEGAKSLSPKQAQLYTQTLEKLVGNKTMQRLIPKLPSLEKTAEKAATLFSHGATDIAKLLSTKGGQWLTRGGAEIVEDIIQTYADQVLTGGSPDKSLDNRFKMTTDDFRDSAVGTIAIKSFFGLAGAGLRQLGKRAFAKEVANKLGKEVEIKAEEIYDDARALKDVVDGKATLEEVAADGTMTVMANGVKKKLENINIAQLKNIDPKQLAKNERLKVAYDDYMRQKGQGLNTNGVISPDNEQAVRVSIIDAEKAPRKGKRSVYTFGELDDGAEVYLSREAAEEVADGRAIREFKDIKNSHIETDGATYRYRVNELTLGNTLPDSSSSIWNRAAVASPLDDASFKTRLKNKIPAGQIHKYKDHIASLYNYARGRIDNIVRQANMFASDLGISPEELTRHFDAIMEADRLKKNIVGGTIVPSANGNIVLDQRIIDFYNRVVEPYMRPLRKAGYAAQKLKERTRAGYLPQIPSGTTAELFPDANTDVGFHNLFKRNWGKIARNESGVFDPSRVSGDLDERLDYFTRQMLVESQGDKGWVYQRMQEAHLNGESITVEQAAKEYKAQKELVAEIKKSPAFAKLDEAFAKITSEGGDAAKVLQTTKEWDDFKKLLESQGKKSDVLKQINDAFHSKEYKTIHPRSHFYDDPHPVTNQAKPWYGLKQNSDVMKDIQVQGLGSFYDNGGALMTNPASFASEIVERAAAAGQTGGRQAMFESIKESLMNLGICRTEVAATTKASKYLMAIEETMDGDTLQTGLAASALSNSIRWDGFNMLKNFCGALDYDTANKQTRDYINNFLYQHSFYGAFLNDSKTTKAMSKAINTLINNRYKAIMAFNYKNALLQLTECSRLATMNGGVSAAKTLKNLATNKNGLNDLTERWLRTLAPDSVRSYMTGSRENLTKASELMDAIKKDGNDYIVDLKKGVDRLALGAIEDAEGVKNRVLLAGIINKAQELGYDVESAEFSSYVRRRWEREVLAADVMGRLAASNNPFMRLATMFMSFPIREAQMHWYNITDSIADRGVLGAATYLIRVLGYQGAMGLMMAPLGYTAISLLGFDPLGITDREYYGMDEEKMTLVDKLLFANNPLFGGAILSAIPDMYFKFRSAYENAKEEFEYENPGEEYEGGTLRMESAAFGIDDLINGALGYIPGGQAGKRIAEMGQLQSQGFWQGSTGNLQYEAPTDFLDTLKGYIFGRTSTERGREYLQRPDVFGGAGRAITTGNIGELTQEIGRLNPGRQFREFDPATSDYSDWFTGERGDAQQMSSALYSLQSELDDIREKYNDRFNRAYGDDEKTRVRNAAEQEVAEVANRISMLVNAYNQKHPEGIDTRTSNWIEGMLEPPESFELQSEDYSSYNTGVNRYARANIPSSTMLQGPTENAPDNQIQRAKNYALINAQQGLYGASNQAPRVIKQAFNDTLKDLKDAYNARLQPLYDKAEGKKGKTAKAIYKEIGNIQEEYMKAFDSVMRPIVAEYGSNILKNADVENTLEQALSGMIPSSEYRVDKKGKTIFQGTPYMNVDVGKYLQKRYEDIAPTGGTDPSTEGEIKRIKQLLDNGSTAAAKSAVRALLNKINLNRATASTEDIKWLIDIKNRKD